ncbi:MAG: hypothetical protein CMP91_03500 [Gammaproteobacteria bacterium]|nr:hypothetical protein [Gammaproteobacteria bacterium]MAY02986.1 hypothetical protein [Gammaproteobacteria bacterium]|tara:strand:+ start:249 stop:755 length:507 start_codon:yes stop_codon:yes gene_type:complete
MSYSRTQKILHWVLAVLILLWLFVSGEGVEGAEGPDKLMAISIHSGGALLILALMTWRWFVRRNNPVQALPELKSWEKTWSARIHVAFYVLVLVMVFSGIMQGVFYDQSVRLAGLVPITISSNETMYGIFHGLHGLTATIFKVLIVLHILAALKHQFIDRKPFIQRML